MFDEAFKLMAIELAEAKGSLSAATEELGFDPGRISKWWVRFKKPDLRKKLDVLTDKQKRIRLSDKGIRRSKA